VPNHQPPDAAPYRLSKSRFTSGLQCHRKLWWEVHEPNAIELQPDKVLQDLFDQGRQVGALARTRYPGGVLIDLPHHAGAERVAATSKALAAGAPAVFEATFIADGTFVAIDVLEKLGDGYRLTEVKSSSSQKDEHISDVAVQARVAAACGVNVTAAQVLHLNKDFRNPDTGDLFARTDVTGPVAAFVAQVPDEIARQREMLAGPLPDVPIGLHCFEPRECPFMGRCWPQAPNHIRHLAGVGPKKTAAYLARGITSIKDLPPQEKLNFTQRRQLKAMAENRLIVEPTLARELAPFASPLSAVAERGTGGEDPRRERGTGGEDPRRGRGTLKDSLTVAGGEVARVGFLDFETIARAIPVWPGMAPWQQAAAQFSYHERQPNATYTHAAFLAEGPEDARPPLAAAMVRATANALRVVTYTAFEKTRIRELQRAVPELAAELAALEAKLIDLYPVVKNCVYHPDFRGSFSLKDILTPLVPELTYNDLVIVDGRVASVEIARLLFVADKIPRHERDRVRQDLLKYCERDTWAMVKLVERLWELARR
jgi:predicted RecB family nuclease